MNIENVVDFLAANGVGVKGKTLFGRSLPASAKSAVLVIANSRINRHPYQKGRRDGTFQVIVRGITYSEIESKAESIMTLLDGEGITMGSDHFLSIYPQHEPMIYPRSEGGLLEASVNYNIIYVN